MPKIKQFIPQDFCLACLGCCRFAQKKSVWQPYKITPVPCKDFFICPHLNIKNNRCKTYTNRPLDCQLYPFLLNKCKGKTYLAIDKKCAYLCGREKDGILKEYTAYLLKLLSSPGMKKFLKDSPGLACEYKDKDIENIAAIEV